MFSYRHAFHAGNHADVLKHTVLLETLSYLLLKDTALTVVDTHAGAGLYRLDGDYAQKSLEAVQGVSHIWDAPQLPLALAHYRDAVKAVNPHGGLVNYPGSPALMANLLRPQDHMHLFELHPTDQQLLQRTVRQWPQAEQIKVHVADGFSGLKALLPPPSRRGLVLMDPSYEIKSDYQRVVESLTDALRRFATGVYLIWYPVVSLPQAHQLPGKLKRMAEKHGRGWLHTVLRVANASCEQQGLLASGVFVINPPYVLGEHLDGARDMLLRYLGRGRGAQMELEQSTV